MKKSTILETFFHNDVCGYSLKTITKKIAEVYTNQQIQINVPYSNFNCKGTAKQIAREVSALTPFSNETIKQITTLFYGNVLANQRGTYFPFQGDCDVYFVEKITRHNKVIVIDLIKAPNWRMLL